MCCKDKLLKQAIALCEKFVNKVESGRARSKETYQDCKDFLNTVNNSKQINNEQLSKGFDETSN